MPLILGTNSIKDTGYDVANSLRFDDGDSAYLERNFSTTQDSRRKFTFSAWVKRGNLTTSTNIWGSSEGSGEGYNSLKFENHKLQYLSGNTSNSGTQVNLETNRLFRDVSSWYHIVLAVDTSQGTDSNRIKFYVNGSQETSFNTSTYPSQDTDLLTSTTPQMTIGMRDLRGTNAQFWDGYMCEVVFIDNQQLAPDQFGEFDEDSPTIWKPKDVSGLTFGTNGFYLDYEDSSALGDDVSGNSNDFTVNNLTAADQSADTCTNNFAVLINLVPNAATYSEGNLKITTSSNWESSGQSIPVTQGKWYAEFIGGSTNAIIGVEDFDLVNTWSVLYFGSSANGVGYWNAYGGQLYKNNSYSSYAGGAYGSTDIVGIHLDMDNKFVYFSINGTMQNSGNPASGSSGTGGEALSGTTYVMGGGNYTGSLQANFGSPPYSESGGNTDANGYGNFKTAPTSGYYSLNSKNLAEFG